MPEKISEKDISEAGILARLDERTERMAEDIDSLKHVLLEGNGVPAITSQVATLNERSRAHDDRLDLIEQEKTRSMGDKAIIWAAVITASVPFLEMMLRRLHVI